MYVAPAPVVVSIASHPAVFETRVVEYIALAASSVTLHLCLSWCTSLLAQAVSYAAPALVLVYFVTAPVAYAAPIATAIGGFASLLVERTVYTRTLAEYIAPASAVYAAPAPVV